MPIYVQFVCKGGETGAFSCHDTIHDFVFHFNAEKFDFHEITQVVLSYQKIPVVWGNGNKTGQDDWETAARSSSSSTQGILIGLNKPNLPGHANTASVPPLLEEVLEYMRPYMHVSGQIQISGTQWSGPITHQLSQLAGVPVSSGTGGFTGNLRSFTGGV